MTVFDDILADELASVKPRRRSRKVKLGLDPIDGVDRTSDRWLRIREACVFAADDIDLDRHADRVCSTIDNLNRGGRSTSTGQSAATQKESK